MDRPLRSGSLFAPDLRLAERPNLTGGYVLAVLLPFIGVIYGLVKIRNGGGGVIAVSILAWIFWAFVFGAV